MHYPDLGLSDGTQIDGGRQSRAPQGQKNSPGNDNGNGQAWKLTGTLPMIWLHHLSHWLYRRKIPLLPKLLDRTLFLLTSCSIPASCSIGRGSYLAHGGVGAVINGDCNIGERVSIGQGITIGGSFGSGVPIVGSDVWISAGARILGEIKIGSNVIIGANAVVIHDVPDNSVVAGVPAHLIRQLAPGALDTLSGSIRGRQGLGDETVQK